MMHGLDQVYVEPKNGNPVCTREKATRVTNEEPEWESGRVHARCKMKKERDGLCNNETM